MRPVFRVPRGSSTPTLSITTAKCLHPQAYLKTAEYPGLIHDCGKSTTYILISLLIKPASCPFPPPPSTLPSPNKAPCLEVWGLYQLLYFGSPVVDFLKYSFCCRDVSLWGSTKRCHANQQMTTTIVRGTAVAQKTQNLFDRTQRWGSVLVAGEKLKKLMLKTAWRFSQRGCPHHACIAGKWKYIHRRMCRVEKLGLEH